MGCFLQKVICYADTAECIDRLVGECTIESYGELLRLRVMRLPGKTGCLVL